jgi:prepilin peptidase CpaA
MILALSYYFFTEGISGLLFSLGGLVIGISIFFILYFMGWMGAGDAKLMGVIGASLGAKGVISVILYTSVVGGIYALILVVSKRHQFNGFFRQQLEGLKSIYLTHSFIPAVSKEKRPKLCYGVAIALGTFIYMGLELSRFGQIIN